jgi:hypothetical protein
MLADKQTLVAPKAEALYPHLVEPDNYEGALDYKVNLVLDPAEKGVQSFLDSITETAEAQLALAVKELKSKGGKYVKLAGEMALQLPFAPEYAEDGQETGRYILKTKSKAAGVTASGKKWERKIPLFDAGVSGKVKPIPHGSVQVFSGSILKVELVTNVYTATGLKIAGVSFFIKAVQVIELSGGSSSNAFGCEEEGFDASDLDAEIEAPDFDKSEETDDDF